VHYKVSKVSFLVAVLEWDRRGRALYRRQRAALLLCEGGFSGMRRETLSRVDQTSSWSFLMYKISSIYCCFVPALPVCCACEVSVLRRIVWPNL